MTKNMSRTAKDMRKKLKDNHIDLIRSANINFVLKIVATILWYIASFISVTTYFDTGGIMQSQMTYVALIIIIILLPFYALKVHRVFLDSTWKGTVSRIEKKTDSIRSSAFFNAGNTYLEYEIVYITHESNVIKKWKMKLRKSDDKFNPVGYYTLGEEVLHYRGLKFCEKLDKTKERYVVCLYCGQLNLPTQGKCKKCRRSVVT